MASCKKLRVNAKKLLGLGLRDITLLLEAWLLLAWVDFVISVLPYRYWSHWLKGATKAGQDFAAKGREKDIAGIIQLSEAAARNHLRPMNCLRRCLAQQRLLRRRQVSSHMHIGVRKTAKGLEAHAWLTSQGQVLNDEPNVGDRYSQLQSEQWQSISHFIS